MREHAYTCIPPPPPLPPPHTPALKRCLHSLRGKMLFIPDKRSLADQWSLFSHFVLDKGVFCVRDKDKLYNSNCCCPSAFFISCFLQNETVHFYFYYGFSLSLCVCLSLSLCLCLSVCLPLSLSLARYYA